jgi:signal transduction histidine kinase
MGAASLDGRPLAGQQVGLRFRAALLVLLCAACGNADPGGAPVLELRAGHFLIDSSLSTPPAVNDGRWASVTLPDAWRATRPGAGGKGWYRFEVLRPPSPAERWAVYLPAVNMTANAYVNGHSVGSGGSIDPPAHNFYRPLYFVFPGALFDKGVNRVDIELGVIPNHFGCLTPLWLGPDALLRPHYERLYFSRVRLVELETFLAFVMAALMTVLWRSSRDNTYGSFALASAFWATSSLNYWVRDLPMSHWAWERLIHASLFAFGAMLAVWSHRLLAIDRPRVTWGLLGAGALVLAAILLLPSEWFYPTVSLLHLLTLGTAGYALVMIMTRFRQLGWGERITYGVGGVMNLGFGAHDLGIMFGWLDQSSSYLLTHSAPILVITFGSSLIRRFAASLKHAERVNEHMEQLLQEKHDALEANYRRLAELERERVLGDERHRLIREMHDGLGSQLTSTLALVERGGADAERLSMALRGALDEMRIVIHSLDSEPRAMPEVLGVLRARLQPILRATGLSVHWHTEDECGGRLFSPEQSLHVLRIIQEAIANAVKHAGATRIEVSARLEEGAQLRLSVADDGRGVDVDTASTGRGLPHMRYRAHALGGELRILPGHPGTCVELLLPVDAAPSGRIQSVPTMPRDTASKTASARERTSSFR